MTDKNQLSMKSILLRILIIFTFTCLIWFFIGRLSETLGEEYSRINHFFIAMLTSILIVILIDFARRVDQVSFKQLISTTIRSNIFSFLIGFILWTIPAMLGITICILVGWVDITLKTDSTQLLLSIIILFITVFLIEALPEELIFRGYIYRYLNVIFPHWSSLILQVLLFSLFSYIIGAIYSIGQILFIPGFALILGYLRAVSGNVWTSIGFHVAIMTVTQILSPLHNHFDVSGMIILQFFAFILFPSIIGAVALDFIYTNHKWGKKEPIL
ncbi:CPBP family intramembrane glutamic endopeptidase [Ferdinandcohnia quinoae]|uniref:CPBP family intramembrane metalloprotease n=1 Tax=Fredinandcohnia quinoae TaxID=2918902 RepID=A0AAW5E285_9BACI|nr:type II CAAX endopeptidase family protein [Fredinandcohnia sp. SECRCQ15]MCH1625385.1 CPBP family intramembrane metalloprotease [Fredinandcohnia sp. SECRCQ15]